MMISNEYLKMMAHYNRWQNGELVAVADTLTDIERRMDRGAFWNSIHGTLSHIYWADRIWLSRFDLVEPPDVPNPQSPGFVADWDDLKDKRSQLDDLVVDWIERFEDGPIIGSLKWFSGAAGRDMEAPLSVVLPHFFNHQTHHRRQVHAMLTGAGVETSDTDLFLMPKECWPD